MIEWASLIADAVGSLIGALVALFIFYRGVSIGKQQDADKELKRLEESSSVVKWLIDGTIGLARDQAKHLHSFLEQDNDEESISYIQPTIVERLCSYETKELITTTKIMGLNEKAQRTTIRNIDFLHTVMTHVKDIIRDRELFKLKNEALRQADKVVELLIEADDEVERSQNSVGVLKSLEAFFKNLHIKGHHNDLHYIKSDVMDKVVAILADEGFPSAYKTKILNACRHYNSMYITYCSHHKLRRQSLQGITLDLVQAADELEGAVST